jgi:hypothetical protein
VRTSPQWTRVSPGGAWVVLNFIAKALRQPLLAPRKALQFCSKVWFRCRQMSACKHSGKPFKTWREKVKSLILPVHCVLQSEIKYISCSQNCMGSQCHTGILTMLLLRLPQWIFGLLNMSKFLTQILALWINCWHWDSTQMLSH